MLTEIRQDESQESSDEIANSGATEDVGIPIAIKRAKYGANQDEGYFDKERSNFLTLTKYLSRHHSPHLIRPIAAYEVSEERYLVSLWADGGDLLEYWKNYENHRSEVDSLHWLLRQLKGVCSAVKLLHDENTRHGDLKPENILWFKKGDRGVLQIADLGLTTFHAKEADTRNRKGIMTITMSGTERYGPPEVHEELNGPRSRKYDIWTMGCVLLESLIWLIYGYGGLKTFQFFTPRFWTGVDTNATYSIDTYVESCMKVMKDLLQKESEPSAYSELLSFVEERLLIVPMSDSYESHQNYRETAKGLLDKMTDIVEKSDKKKEHPTPYLRPIKSEYPADIIEKQQTSNKVYLQNGGLGVPMPEGAPKHPSTLSTSHAPASSTNHEPVGDRGHLPKIMIRAPTDLNADTNSSKDTIHQQVSSSHYRYLGECD